MATNTERIHDLAEGLISLEKDAEYLKKDFPVTRDLNKEYETKLSNLQNEVSLMKQRLEDHLKRMEVWSGRLWGFIVLLIGAVLSLSSGLIVTLVRK